MHGVRNTIFAWLLGTGILIGNYGIANAQSKNNCDQATFHFFGVEVDDKGTDSILVLKYKLLASETARCVTPEKYPLIVPKTEVYCQREINNVCGMSSPLFKAWSYDAFSN